ncbi:MAG: hypothetical protein WAV02_16465 [Stellaceae bacterium]
MDKRTAGLLGAVASIAAIGPAQAATPALPKPPSYADLLAPIPNAVALLKADDHARAQNPAPLKLAQYHDHHHHHHHHHHHNWWYGGGYYGPPCHWTWGPPYWNGFRWVHPRVQVCD